MRDICPNCLYPTTHPLGIILEGKKCSGCITHEEKDTIDWGQKEYELSELISRYKKKTKTYDCVLPVTGDAEDFFVVSKVLGLGLQPLVVSVNDYFKNDIGWHNLHQLITYFDVDSIIYNPDMHVYKELVRTSLRKYNHILLPFLQLQTSFPVHIANERKIPLIIWGQNQAVEQAGKFSHNDKVEMSKWSRKEHDLFGLEIDDLIGNGSQVEPRCLNYYQYPNIREIERSNISGIYLSNFYRWDPLAQNASTLSFGFQPESNQSSFDVYERAGSSVYYKFHNLLKRKRTRYGKVRDHIAREIRHGRLKQEEGFMLEQKYNNVKINIKPFFDWIGASRSGYEWFVKHRLSGLSDEISTVTDETFNVNLPLKLEKLIFESSRSATEFITLGKGINI